MWVLRLILYLKYKTIIFFSGEHFTKTIYCPGCDNRDPVVVINSLQFQKWNFEKTTFFNYTDTFNVFEVGQQIHNNIGYYMIMLTALASISGDSQVTENLRQLVENLDFVKTNINLANFSKNGLLYIYIYIEFEFQSLFFSAGNFFGKNLTNLNMFSNVLIAHYDIFIHNLGILDRFEPKLVCLNSNTSFYHTNCYLKSISDDFKIGGATTEIVFDKDAYTKFKIHGPHLIRVSDVPPAFEFNYAHLIIPATLLLTGVVVYHL